MKRWCINGLELLAVVLVVSSCGRYFATPLQPATAQVDGMTVNDDGSITYDLDRLAITLRPMTDDEMNRLASPGGDVSVNPYTFGDIKKPGETWTESRFTIFRLQVANYQFPKVQIHPENSQITASNRRQYSPLNFSELYDYYRSHWLGRTGQGRADFRARTDMLNRTLFSDDFIFSGSDADGFIVFPRLDDDVLQIQIELSDIAVRFDYADEPVETVDLVFQFERDVLRGKTPTDAVRVN